MELVSIIMPSYNCEKFISESIRSICNQTYLNWELLVVDDCSTDCTRELVHQFSEQDARIHGYCLERNCGAAAARNYGIERAKGAYIAFLDSDDLWDPEKLEKQLAFMKEHHAGFSCTAYRKIDEAGKPLHRVVTPAPKADYWYCLYYGNSVGNSTAMYKIGPEGKIYAPDIRKRNDFAMWLRVLKTEPYVLGMQEVLATYRVRSDSLSAKKSALIRYQWQLYRKIEKLSVFRSVYAMGCLFVRKCWDACKDR